MTGWDRTVASSAHYARIAQSYDVLWDRSAEFRAWMTGEIIEHSGLRPGATVIDLGGGTGIFAAQLCRSFPGLGRVVVVDPSEEMLSHVPAEDILSTVCADAAAAPDVLTRAGIVSADLILVKEAVHHFEDRERELRGLVPLLAPGGRILVVMLPTAIEYPLFEAALTRFTELQPDPAHIAAVLSECGLEVSVTTGEFGVELPSSLWQDMVARRFMSVLSTFDDSELEQGVAEIETSLAGAATVSFPDLFTFVEARQR